MDLKAALTDLKNRAMGAVEQAARERDTGRIVVLSDVLAEIERDEKAALALEDRIRSHEARLKNPSEMAGVSRPPEVPDRRKGKAFGREVRGEFASRHHLTPEKGVVYRTQSGSRVGLAPATERVPNAWFLGLPDTQVDCVVLLCERDGGVLDFVLPMASISSVWPRLSRSGGQVKFNVRKKNGAYQLQVPGAGPLDIRPFLGQYGPLA